MVISNGTRTGKLALIGRTVVPVALILLIGCSNQLFTMATPLDLPLPEITVDDFQRAWTSFELVAAAKEWNDDKQKVILPTLLRGKLVDIYMTLNGDTRGDLPALKKTLMRQAGLLRDPLTASQSFMSRRQASEEKKSLILSKT